MGLRAFRKIKFFMRKKIIQSLALTPSTIEKIVIYLSSICSLISLTMTPLLTYWCYQLPFEQTQGIHVRMMFLHVPAAIASMFSYQLMALGSLMYLIWSIKYGLQLILHFARPAFYLSIFTLITGSLWGKPTWGTYWIWDARLTTTLILSIILGCVLTMLCIPSNKNKKFYKTIAIIIAIGWVDLPLIRYSVEWFHTLHQGASLSLFKKSSIDQTYLIPLLGMIFCFLSYSISQAGKNYLNSLDHQKRISHAEC